jgi:hypothetical protein
MTVAALDAQQLIEAASAQTGLSDLGGDEFVEPLDRFLRACAEDGCVSPAGLEAIGQTLTAKIGSRLRFERDLKEHPEILDEEIVAPLILIGAGRVGSTKMHRLLANASGVQSLPFWQLQSPGRIEGGEIDPRLSVCEAFCSQIESAMPQLFAAIEPIATEPDEEIHLFDLTFMQFYFCALAYAPSYLDWIFEQDWDGPYEYFSRLLQYLQWQNGTSGKPMLLKGPFHTGYMDILLRLFPEAKFVQLHRDPVTCAASLGKVAWMLQSTTQGTATKEQYGRLLEGYITRQFLDNMRLREQIPQERIADYSYQQVVDDALGLAREIFAFWGQPLSEADLDAMRGWEQANAQHKYGRFEYTLEEMGVDRDRMESGLAPYMDRFFPDG